MNFRELTQQELVEILGISKPTVVAMGKEAPPLPSSKAGQNRLYDLQRVVAFLQDRAVRKAGLSQQKRLSKTDVPDQAVSDARKAAADADLAELKVAREKGQLIHLADYERAWALRIQRHREGLAAIQQRVATRIGPENAAVVGEEIRRVLGAMDQVQVQETA